MVKSSILVLVTSRTGCVIWWKVSRGMSLQIVLNYFQFGPLVQEVRLFKIVFYLELWWPSWLAEWNHIANFRSQRIKVVEVWINFWVYRYKSFNIIFLFSTVYFINIGDFAIQIFLIKKI